MTSASQTSPVTQFIGSMALVVNDYDEAIDFFTTKLDFELVCDEILSPTKRWVLVRPPWKSHSTPPPAGRCSLLLAKADGEVQKEAVGSQSGGRVFMFLHTDDFHRDFQKMTARGIKFTRPPAVYSYGTVAVFEDLYGNKWDLVQMNQER